ncbi:MAG TPA: Ig domain-containing protein [Clostridia bacterium]|nr:Ig domain-containing protein [Clostridia bacterium]
MLRLFKSYLWLGLLAGGFQAAFGFSLLGPINEPYQVPTIGYNLAGDLGAPKNLGEEYRRNTPVMYYACDANFLDYFGSNGVAAIDSAFAVFNALTNVSSYSGDLMEFPMNTQRKNWRAEALRLVDLKSITMMLMVEQLGLAEPERYTWTLHDRWLLPNTQCPFGEVYLVVKRNFDPAFGTSLDQLKPTSYVNGTLYSYYISEICTGPNPLAVTVPFAVDVTADTGTAVASAFGSATATSPYGLFFTGLTRDDIGGLRYLLRANNFNVENAAANTLAYVTNTSPQLLVTSNLTLLASQSLTNSAAALQALYPNLLVTSSSNYFVSVLVTNFTPYFTNFPWDPLGTAPALVYATNITPTILTLYSHTFGNVLRLVNSGGRWSLVPLGSIPERNGKSYVTIETATVGVYGNPWEPAGSTRILTNSTYVTYLTNDVVGDYVILPPTWCDAAIIASQLTNVVATTNTLFVATNNLVSTNGTGSTNAGTLLSYGQNIITYYTNHTFVVFPVLCEGTNVALRGGIEKVSFVRRDFDSLLNRFFVPITNEYVMPTMTNYAVVPQRIQRVISTPDFLFTAQDRTPGPDGEPAANIAGRNVNFVSNSVGAYVGLAGPGIIDSPTTITFNKVGPIYYNGLLVDTNAFVTEMDHIEVWRWGSFDGTTNAPVVYPNDLSVFNLENQMLIQVSPPSLPDGITGSGFHAELQTQASIANWKAPYTWSLAPSSFMLPPGLTISNGANSTGILSGTPIQPGTYDFIIRVTDAEGRTVDRGYSMRVVPGQ